MTPDAPTWGQWARDVADTYSALAASETWPQRRAALDGEAAKYYGIAARMDRIPGSPAAVSSAATGLADPREASRE